MEKKEIPNYYAIIPARVRYAHIKANSKLLYGEISALCNSSGYCWASNSYFSNLYEVSDKQVSLWIKELNDHHFIEIELIKSKDGTARKLYLLEEKVIRALPKGNVGHRGSTLPKGNTNNTYNNTYNKNDKKYKTIDELSINNLSHKCDKEALNKFQNKRKELNI